jgi:hypothetical protein
VSEEEEPLGVLEEEEEPPVGIGEEEESPPTSPLSCPMKPPLGMREEERCGGGWSFQSPTYMREEERRGSREKQTSRSGLGPATSRVLNAC